MQNEGLISLVSPASERWEWGHSGRLRTVETAKVRGSIERSTQTVDGNRLGVQCRDPLYLRYMDIYVLNSESFSGISSGSSIEHL